MTENGMKTGGKTGGVRRSGLRRAAACLLAALIGLSAAWTLPVGAFYVIPTGPDGMPQAPSGEITENLTVSAGTTRTFDSFQEHTLKSGVTLTVEKGGLLILEGIFCNIGTIINRGTVVVEGAVIASSDNMQYGELICDGGTVIVSEHGKLFVNEKADRLIVKKGGSLLIYGCVVVPNSLTVDDSTLYVGKGGTLICEQTAYGYLQGISNAGICNPGTVNVCFTWSNPYDAQYSVRLKDHAYFCCDGVFTYLDTPAYDVSAGRYTMPHEGSGVWKKIEEQKTEQGGGSSGTSGDGSYIRESNADGTWVHETWTKNADNVPKNQAGVSEWTADTVRLERTLQNGNTYLTTWLKDGSRIERAGSLNIYLSYLVYNPDGSIREGRKYAGDDSTGLTGMQNWVWSAEHQAFIRGYFIAQKGIKGAYYAEFPDGRTASVTVESSGIGYCAVGTCKDGDRTVYTIRADEVDAGVHFRGAARTFADHVERLFDGDFGPELVAGGRVAGAEYTAGRYQGAHYQVAESFYTSAAGWKKGEILWSVTSTAGTTFVCRAEGGGSSVTFVTQGERALRCADTVPVPTQYLGHLSLSDGLKPGQQVKTAAEYGISTSGQTP